MTRWSSLGDTFFSMLSSLGEIKKTERFGEAIASLNIAEYLGARNGHRAGFLIPYLYGFKGTLESVQGRLKENFIAPGPGGGAFEVRRQERLSG